MEKLFQFCYICIKRLKKEIYNWSECIWKILIPSWSKMHIIKWIMRHSFKIYWLVKKIWNNWF